jgi:fermentation-respiration switch protein FrsA (DUF1100 family)
MKRASRLVWIVLGTVVALYGAACVGLWMLQERLVYFPGPPVASEPKDHGLAGEALFLKTTDDVRLYAWIVRADRPRGAVLFLHGNAGTVEDRVEHARAFHAMGFTTLLLDYRGYGASGGRPNETGTYLDAEAGYEQLVRAEGFDAGRIALFGESLGGGPAIELARRKPCGAVILQGTFTSIPAIGAKLYPWLPVRLLARVRYDNLAKIAQVPAALLVLHSRDDEIVPFAHGEALFAAALPPKRFVPMQGSHVDAVFYARAEWRRAVEETLDAMLQRRGSR